jgi:hypothetical protein
MRLLKLNYFNGSLLRMLKLAFFRTGLISILNDYFGAMDVPHQRFLNVAMTSKTLNIEIGTPCRFLNW